MSLLRQSALLAALYVASVAGASAATVIHACYNKTSGDVRIVASISLCKSTEKAVSWNIDGPSGPRGPAGPAGPQGPPGETNVPANLTALSGQLSTTNGVADLGATSFVSAGCSNMNIGDIILSVNGYGEGALPADGRLLSISEFTPAFALIGTNFGGDGVKTFGLPDLRAFAPKGLQYSICVEGIFPPRL